MNNDDYQELVNNYKPKENKISNAFSAFIIGGLLGFISEFISFLLIKYFNISKDESYQIIGLVMIIFTCFLTTIGIFDNFVSKAKCGLVIPTTGFAHSIASTILDYKKFSEGGIVMKTIFFENTYLNDYYLLIGNDEKEKVIKYNFCLDDYYFGESTFELAEIKMQRFVIQNLINKNKLADRDIDALISGDLNNQIVASSYGARDFNIPFLGIYGACSSFIQGIILSGILLKNKEFKKIITCVSSHALVAERLYRYPIEYGHSRPGSATVTATGAISHLKNSNKKVEDYDLILTGDLGKIGLKILKIYYSTTFNEKLTNISDAGSILYQNKKNKYAGGSGPCCLPLIFLGKIIKERKYHKILLLGTGSLHNTTLVNQKLSIPSVCHALEVEVQ